MEIAPSDCPFPGCLFCVMKEDNPTKRRAGIIKFFKDLPLQDEDGQVLPISGLWNTAMAHPNDPEFIELGIFECMAALIWKGLKNRRWLSRDQNIYIPYYAAHIIGSYTMNLEEFAVSAVNALVIPPLVELLRGRLTWVEQRVAVRALGHLATYASTFSIVSNHEEVLELAIQLALSSLEIVYSQFHKSVDRSPQYHCNLLTRGMGGTEMGSRKAESILIVDLSLTYSWRPGRAGHMRSTIHPNKKREKSSPSRSSPLHDTTSSSHASKRLLLPPFYLSKQEGGEDSKNSAKEELE